MAAKVRMRSPDDGKVYEFDRAHAVEAQRNGWTPALNAGQQVGKAFADALPPAVGLAGALAGTPGGPGGIAVGGMAGGAMGGGGQLALYNLLGIPTDQSPLGSVAHMAGQGVREGAMALPNAAAAGLPGAAPGLMKAALGNAQPGVEKVLLAEGLDPTPGGLAKAKRLISDLTRRKAEFMRASTQEFGREPIVGALRGAARSAKAADVVSPADADALNAAMKYAEKLLGPKVKGAGVSVLMDEFGKPIVKEGTTIPAKALTLRRLEAIRRWADRNVRLYEAMRKGQNVADPGPLEKAYLAVGEATRGIINKLPTGGPNGETYGELNARLSSLMDARSALFNQAKRSRWGQVTASAVGALGVGGPAAALSHNPAAGLLAVPGAMAAHAATSPENLGRMAFAAQDPRTAFVLRNLLRPADFGASLLGLGAPDVEYPDTTGGRP